MELLSHRSIKVGENPQPPVYDAPSYFRSSVTRRFRMKLKVLLFLLVVTLCPASLFSNSLYFPQVAYGGGYSTTFVIVNTGTTAVAARLNFYSQSGAPLADLGTQVSIAAGNSTRITLPDTGRSP